MIRASRLPNRPHLGQQGVTLIEMIVVISLMSILILISGVGISLFFRKYKELNAWSELQKDGVECLNYIKNGIPVGTQSVRVNDNGDMEFNRPKEYYGVTNALALKFVDAPMGASTAKGIRITPPAPEGLDTNDFAQFYLYDGAVRCSYKYRGVQSSSPLYLFPKKGKRDQMTLERFELRKLNTDQEVYAVEVILEAKVKTGPGTFRQIKYRTKMAKK
jgi:prepilin-type N-terminal cleavage/methylation domain-containing protein